MRRASADIADTSNSPAAPGPSCEGGPGAAVGAGRGRKLVGAEGNDKRTHQRRPDNQFKSTFLNVEKAVVDGAESKCKSREPKNCCENETVPSFYEEDSCKA